jgi:hypothetical protein
MWKNYMYFIDISLNVTLITKWKQKIPKTIRKKSKNTKDYSKKSKNTRLIEKIVKYQRLFEKIKKYQTIRKIQKIPDYSNKS